MRKKISRNLVVSTINRSLGLTANLNMNTKLNVTCRS